MLVLTRKEDESIRIGSNVVIKVIKTKSGSVKIGIEAPANVRVMRAELATLEEFNIADIFTQNGDELLDDCMLEALMVQS